MRLVLQRVSKASVEVEKKIVGSIEHGLLVLVGLAKDDGPEVFKAVTEKILNMRIFSNDKGRFDHSVQDIGGGILLIPQFTLFADVTRGRRPEFFNALEPGQARPLFDDFVNFFRKHTPLKVESGVFGADMKVELLNDGPVTIVFDTKDL